MLVWHVEIDLHLIIRPSSLSVTGDPTHDRALSVVWRVISKISTSDEESRALAEALVSPKHHVQAESFHLCCPSSVLIPFTSPFNSTLTTPISILPSPTQRITPGHTQP